MVLLQSSYDISERLRKMMKTHRVTQRALADAIGISFQLMNAKLHGRANFTLRDVSRIADYFGVSTHVLLGRERVLFIVAFTGCAGIEAFVDGEWFLFFYCLLIACCGLLFLVCGIYGAVGGR